jgi:multimeric flavodoxin WrbA
MRVLVLKASPRRDGNSALLADAAAAGAGEAGHEVTVRHLDDAVEGMLRDCRTCRRADGSCGIDDGYERLLLEDLVPADALVLATPLYWYGMSGRLKSAVDRLFCFMSEGYPGSGAVLSGLPGKRVGVLVACEESYRGATLGLQAQFQELTRYLRGIGNSRGDVRLDPGNPLGAAADLGRRLFDARVTDYRFDTPRNNSVWSSSD